MLNKNNKMAINNNKGVERTFKTPKGLRLDMKFFFLSNRGHQDIGHRGY
jgi:hypothetical protein